MRMKGVGVRKTKQKKSLETLENTMSAPGKQMANIGKRSVDSHGEMVTLHGHNISINMFQKLMAESGTEKTFGLKGNNALFFFKLKTEEFDNFNSKENADKRRNWWYISFGIRKIFNMFQNLTTKRKGMVVGNPAPKAFQGSSGSPMPVLVL